MTKMGIIRAILAVLFMAMGLSIAIKAWRVRRLGLLLGAVIYAVAGAFSFVLESWWPLVAGFTAALALRRMGADPPTDLRFDLPTLERGEIGDASRLRWYTDKWLSTDTQVALVASRFVNEAWDRGLRKPPHIPDAPEWSANTAVAAWQEMVNADLRRLAVSSKEENIRHLDEIDQLSTLTLVVAGETTVQYDLPAAPPHFALVESKIPDVRTRDEYASAYVADAILAARLRVLAWMFQPWHGERYEIPEKRRASK